MDDKIKIYEVDEEHISLDEWDELLSTMEKRPLSPPLDIDERRIKQKPIPDNPSEYLNHHQLESINKLEGFGWELFFIRRAIPEEVLTIMRFPSTGMTALIEKDGSINTSHDVYIRS